MMNSKDKKELPKVQRLFIKNLKSERKRKNLSQMQLANVAEISTSYLGEIETGRKFPTVTVMQKIIDALNIPPYALFIDEDKPDDLYKYGGLKLLKEEVTSLINSRLDAFLSSASPGVDEEEQ